RGSRTEAFRMLGGERVEQSLGVLSAGLTVHMATVTRGLIEGTKGKRLVRSSVQTLGRSCVGIFIMDCGLDSRFGAEDGFTHNQESAFFRKEWDSVRLDGDRIAEWHHEPHGRRSEARSTSERENLRAAPRLRPPTRRPHGEKPFCSHLSRKNLRILLRVHCQ